MIWVGLGIDITCFGGIRSFRCYLFLLKPNFLVNILNVRWISFFTLTVQNESGSGFNFWVSCFLINYYQRLSSDHLEKLKLLRFQDYFATVSIEVSGQVYGLVLQKDVKFIKRRVF